MCDKVAMQAALNLCQNRMKEGLVYANAVTNVILLSKLQT